MTPERRRRVERETPASQLTFLSPDDAELLHFMRRFMAEASRLYEIRTGRDLEHDIYISSPRDAYEFLRFEMEALEQEQLRVLNLNIKNRVLSAPMIYQGTINMTEIRIAEVFRPAILENAGAIIIAHNHPSSDPTPSPEDVRITRNLVQAGSLLGIEVLDHIVIGRGRFVSLKERGLGFGS